MANPKLTRLAYAYVLSSNTVNVQCYYKVFRTSSSVRKGYDGISWCASLPVPSETSKKEYNECGWVMQRQNTNPNWLEIQNSNKKMAS